MKLPTKSTPRPNQSEWVALNPERVIVRYILCERVKIPTYEKKMEIKVVEAGRGEPSLALVEPRPSIKQTVKEMAEIR
jgi:hypothetical protein